jgi:tetratricopeptide (TPR) repeat protein/sugar lactone lactonase YvrE
VLRHPGNGDIRATAFSPDQRVLVAADSQSVRVWNLHGARERLVLRGHEGGVNAVAFSPDRRLLASGSKDRNVNVWNAETGALVATLPRNAFVQGVAFSPDSSLLASADYSGQLRIVDARTFDELARVDTNDSSMTCVGFSPNGRFLAAVANGMTLWSIQRGSDPSRELRLERVAQQSGNRSLYLRFSPDGRWLAWVDDYSRIRLWDLEAGQERPWQPSRQLRGWHNLGFHADSRRLFFVSSVGRVEAWDVVENRLAASLGQPGEVEGSHVAISPSGNWLAVDFAPYSIGVWDTRSSRRLFVLPDERATINSMAFSPDDRRLAVGTKDGGLAIWDIVSLRRQLGELGLDWHDAELPAEPSEPPQRIPTPLEVLNDALAANPRDAESYLRRARVHVRANDIAKALADLDQALALKPEVTEAWLERALLRYRMGRLPEAIDDCTRVIQLDPNEPRARYTRGASCAQLGDWEQAVEDYSRAVELEPSNHWSWYKGAAAMYKAPAERRQEFLRRFLDRYGDTSDPALAERTSKALLCDASPIDVERLAALADRAVNAGAHTYLPYFQFAQGLAQYRQGRYKESLETVEAARRGFTRITNLMRDDALTAHCLLVSALCRQELGEHEAAAKNLADGRELVETQFKQLDTPAGLGSAWHDWIFAQVLLEQAQASVGKSTQP